MRKSLLVKLSILALLTFVSATSGVSAAAQTGEFTISASPSPATISEEISLIVTGTASCPSLGDIDILADAIEVQLRDDCPFIPPTATPFALETTVGPLDAGSYDLRLVIPTGEVLATGQLEILADGICRPTASSLCLQDRRFQVDVSWRTPEGQFGPGQAVNLTEDSGFFYFFNPENVELVVKVIDACAAPFNRFWVFAAGLTNVEVEITVTDTQTNSVKVYNNPLGQPFAPIQDNNAFNTCP